MSRKHSTALLNTPLIIIMVLSLALPAATFFFKYVKTKQRYQILQDKYLERQKEFEDTVLYKIGSVDKIQKKRQTYDNVNKKLKGRQCTSVEMATKLLDEFDAIIKTKSSRNEILRIDTKRDELDKSYLPGYDTVLREHVHCKASMKDFWRIMSQLTRIGHKAFYCDNNECSRFEVNMLQADLEDVKNCPECKQILKKGIIPVFNYVEKFHMDTKSFKKARVIELDFVIAIPIVMNTEN